MRLDCGSHLETIELYITIKLLIITQINNKTDAHVGVNLTYYIMRSRKTLESILLESKKNSEISHKIKISNMIISQTIPRIKSTQHLIDY